MKMKTIVQPVKRPLTHTQATVNNVKTHTRSTATAHKPRTQNGSQTIQITTTKPMIAALVKIKDTGLYGNSVAATAERLLCDAVRAVLKEGTLIRAKKVLC